MFSVKSNVNEVLSFVDRLGSQYEFAVASALTQTVKEIHRELPAQVEKDLDRPTRFTRQGFFYKGADKRGPLVAIVGAKDKQATYLQWQIYGGDRYPTRKALKLPGEIQLDESGNIKRQDLKRLIAEAKRVRKATRSSRAGYTSYTGKSRGVFYGKPANNPKLPVGIYRRVEADNGQQTRFLQPLVLFSQQKASYKQTFDFMGFCRRQAAARFTPALRQAWARAKATAR